MNCAHARQNLDAWVDGELDSATSADIAGHVGQCAACAALRDGRAQLQRRVRSEASYYRAPDALKDAVRRSLGAAVVVAPPRKRGLSWLQAGALAGVCALLGAFGAYSWMAPARDAALFEQVVERHVASLRPGHALTEVASLDRHTVKPWFHGKVDFAPVVLDLSAEGYVLEGARVDAVGSKPAAAIVYRLRKHPVNLFVWRAAGTQPVALEVSTLRGYAVAAWAEGGLRFAAVTDAELRELERFARLIEKGSQ